MRVDMVAMGIAVILATSKRFPSLIMFSKEGKTIPTFLITLWDITVPIARMAPSHVDILDPLLKMNE